MLVNTTGPEEAHSRGHDASVLKDSVTSDHDSGASLFFASAVAESSSTSADEEENAEFVWMFSVRTRRDFESPGQVIRLQCFVERVHQLAKQLKMHILTKTASADALVSAGRSLRGVKLPHTEHCPALCTHL
jgi:hypothetical protein